MGIPEYWIIDAEERSVTVVRPGRADQVVRNVLLWQPSSAYAMLSIALSALFD